MSVTASPAGPGRTAKPDRDTGRVRAPGRHRVDALINPVYIGYDLMRNLRVVSSMFFIVLLPTALYVFFGALQSWSTIEVGNGANVSANTMVSMAAYGAYTATTSLAGMAVLERMQGWGRQLALASYSGTGFIVGKLIVALVVAMAPIAVVYATGALTNARMPGWMWFATGAIVLAGAALFALYGLACSFWFRSEGAVSAASGMLTVFAFLGNAFMPLSGGLLEFSRFTPMYGVVTLAHWPIAEGAFFQTDGTTTVDPLWMPIANVAAWLVVFGGAALLGARRSTAR